MCFPQIYTELPTQQIVEGYNVQILLELVSRGVDSAHCHFLYLYIVFCLTHLYQQQ